MNVPYRNHRITTTHFDAPFDTVIYDIFQGSRGVACGFAYNTTELEIVEKAKRSINWVLSASAVFGSDDKLAKRE